MTNGIYQNTAVGAEGGSVPDRLTVGPVVCVLSTGIHNPLITKVHCSQYKVVHVVSNPVDKKQRGYFNSYL